MHCMWEGDVDDETTVEVLFVILETLSLLCWRLPPFYPEASGVVYPRDQKTAAGLTALQVGALRA
jgi:hypothetical protein